MGLQAPRPPVILIGMHRSGTSMIARVASRLGLFVGSSLLHQYEARFFYRLNEWILAQTNSAWDRPCGVHELLQHERARALVVDYLRMMTRSPRAASYLGWRGYLRYRAIDRIDFAWGWKDPRSTFTLPLWLELFPDARVVHIVRHGVDIARSLQVREDHRIERSAERYARLKPIYVARPKRGGFIRSVRCSTLEGGMGLWNEYVNEARQHVSAAGERGLEIRYEDFLRDPAPVARRLCDFIGLEPRDELLREAVADIQPGRAFAYLENDSLARFSERHAAELATFGYST